MAADGAGPATGHDAAAESMLAAIVDSSPDAIIGKTLDGVITSWNAGAQRMYGYAAEEIIGRNISVLIPPDRADELPSILALLRQGSVIEHFDTYRVRKNGAVIPVSMAISSIRDQAGVVLGAASVAREMTDRDRSEADRRWAEARLQQAERMETIGQLAGGVAHDFNNLLGAITAYAGFLADATADHPDMHSDAIEIQSAVKRAAALVSQLLTFSRRKPGEARLVDLKAIIEDSRALLSVAAGGLDLTVTAGPPPPLILADRTQIEQVLLNLAINARDAMPQGGTLTISARPAELTEEDRLVNPDVKPGRYTELAVSDTGTGMSAEVMARIFEPYFTTKPTGKGTGLGLSTVYGIVRQAGGAIMVESKENRGTVFRLYFPAQAAAGVARSRNGDTPAAAILVVDDEPSLLAAASRMLRQQGYTVYTAGSGEQALAIMRDHDIQLLVADTIMPDITGPALASRISQLKPGIPVLHMSGYTGNLLPGAVNDLAFIQKPFTSQQLSDKVQDVLTAAS
jgi:PAS domain S-box-containing protein